VDASTSGIDVFAEGVVEISPADDEDAIGALTPALEIQRSQIAFARCLDRRPDDAHVGGGEDRVERVGVLGVRSLMRNFRPPTRSA